MANKFQSPLATQIVPDLSKVRTVKGEKTTLAKELVKRKPWGLLLHTSGRGVPAKAVKTGKSVMDVALSAYLNSQNGSNGYLWGGPTYILGHKGESLQICDEDIRTHHAGGPDRANYLSGKWIELASKQMVAHWFSRWGPKFKNPQQLYPSTSPNVDYVGVEMIPCGGGLGTPMREGLLFTKEEHDKVIELGKDLAKRHGWPKGWAKTSRLLGHEDVQPIERDDLKGGWDPGFLREKPYFDFEYVRAGLI